MSEAVDSKEKLARFHEEVEARIVRAGRDGCFFDLTSMEKSNFGRHYSSGASIAVRGERVQVVLVNKRRGSGARLHTHANEQFNFVIEGRLKFRVGDVEGLAGPGQVIYIPANVEHYTRATTEEDVVYFASKDTSYYASGDPVDPTESGAYYEPGFEPQARREP